MKRNELVLVANLFGRLKTLQDRRLETFYRRAFRQLLGLRGSDWKTEDTNKYHLDKLEVCFLNPSKGTNKLLRILLLFLSNRKIRKRVSIVDLSR